MSADPRALLCKTSIVADLVVSAWEKQAGCMVIERGLRAKPSLLGLRMGMPPIGEGSSAPAHHPLNVSGRGLDDPPLGDDPRDQFGRGHVEGIVDRPDALRGRADAGELAAAVSAAGGQDLVIALPPHLLAERPRLTPRAGGARTCERRGQGRCELPRQLRRVARALGGLAHRTRRARPWRLP